MARYVQISQKELMDVIIRDDSIHLHDPWMEFCEAMSEYAEEIMNRFGIKRECYEDVRSMMYDLCAPDGDTNRFSDAKTISIRADSVKHTKKSIPFNDMVKSVRKGEPIRK